MLDLGVFVDFGIIGFLDVEDFAAQGQNCLKRRSRVLLPPAESPQL